MLDLVSLLKGSIYLLIMTEKNLYKIGQIANKANVTLRTVRYYEELGLIKPVERTQANYRLYSENVVKAIKLIKNLQDLGFTLEKIQELFLSLESDDNSSVATLNTTREILNAEKQKIKEKLIHYQSLSDDIDFSLSIIESCFKCREQRGIHAPCKPGCENSSFHIKI
ncbi:MAG: MerR family transcriptional regulator [Vampirovibrionia bacterium]